MTCAALWLNCPVVVALTSKPFKPRSVMPALKRPSYTWRRAKTLTQEIISMSKSEIFNQLQIIEHVLIQARVQLVGALDQLDYVKQQIIKDLESEHSHEHKH
jgi:hypothetical protein